MLESSTLEKLGDCRADIPASERSRELRELAEALHGYADMLDDEPMDDARSEQIRDKSSSGRLVELPRLATGKSDLLMRAKFVLAIGAWRNRCLGQRFFADEPLKVLMQVFIADLEKRKLSVNSLAESSKLDASSMAGAIETLSRPGYLRIAENNDDRVPQIMLTPPGLIRVLRFLTDQEDGNESLRWPLLV